MEIRFNINPTFACGDTGEELTTLSYSYKGSCSDEVEPWVHTKIVDMCVRDAVFIMPNKSEGKTTQNGFFLDGDAFIDKIWVHPHTVFKNSKVILRDGAVSHTHLMDIIASYHSACVGRRDIIMNLAATLRSIKSLNNDSKVIMSHVKDFRDFKEKAEYVEGISLNDEMVWDLLEWSCKDKKSGGDGRSILRHLIQLYVSDVKYVN